MRRLGAGRGGATVRREIVACCARVPSGRRLGSWAYDGHMLTRSPAPPFVRSSGAKVERLAERSRDARAAGCARRTRRGLFRKPVDGESIVPTRNNSLGSALRVAGERCKFAPFARPPRQTAANRAAHRLDVDRQYGRSSRPYSAAVEKRFQGETVSAVAAKPSSRATVSARQHMKTGSNREPDSLAPLNEIRIKARCELGSREARHSASRWLARTKQEANLPLDRCAVRPERLHVARPAFSKFLAPKAATSKTRSGADNE